MKARKRNIISFAICALFIAGLLAGSCYIKEGKQNAVVPVEGYNSKTQGEIKWAYDTVSGDSNSPAINVRIVGVYQEDGDTSKNITDDIYHPDKIPDGKKWKNHCLSQGRIVRKCRRRKQRFCFFSAPSTSPVQALSLTPRLVRG